MLIQLLIHVNNYFKAGIYIDSLLVTGTNNKSKFIIFTEAVAQRCS